jgi:hypothetical protein
MVASFQRDYSLAYINNHLSQMIQTGQTAQFSDHPLTQDLLRQMQED